MNGEIVTHDDAVVDKAIKTLKATGKLRVKADEEFWILCKSWRNSGFPYGYAPSKDGIHPLDKYRMFSHSELYNWLAHLEILDP